MGRRIAIADAADIPGSCDFKRDFVASSRDVATLCVNDFNPDN